MEKSLSKNVPSLSGVVDIILSDLDKSVTSTQAPSPEWGKDITSKGEKNKRASG